MRGEAISMTGTWMQLMAQSWVMTTLTDSATMLGMVNFAAGVPMIALSMFGGSVADRHDKRRILLMTQVVQIILALLVGWLVATHRIEIWHILVVAVLLGISNSFVIRSISSSVGKRSLIGLGALAAATELIFFFPFAAAFSLLSFLLTLIATLRLMKPAAVKTRNS